MKKTILLFTFLLASFYGFSQNSVYGVRAGVNFSSLNFDTNNVEKIDGRTAFAIGFFGEYTLSDCFAFAPEIQFSAEGAKNQSLRINYIQVPLFFKYKLSDSFALGLGPQASLKGHSFEDELQNLGFSALAGIEYMISDEFFIDARYSYGFTNVFDDKVNTPEAKNTNIQIGVGVKF